MLVLVIVLALTNLATLAALWLARRAPAVPPEHAEVFEAPRPPGVDTRERRLITVEILDPLELAGRRGGRIVGLAGTFAPRMITRVVYEQTLKILRSELAGQSVRADVRVHTLRAVPRGRVGAPGVIEVAAVDEVAPLDLTDP